MSNIAFIFARGGSKGLPGKNIKLLGGKPLLAYSIELAKNLPELVEVFVSTDDLQIAKVAEQYGAKVILRPAELARDDSSEWEAWRHAIKYVKELRGEFSIFVSLPATSPLRSEEDVKRGIAALTNEKADMCVAITESGRNPYFNMVRKTDEHGTVELSAPSGTTYTRRQDLPAMYDLTTVLYVSTPDFILNNNGIFSGKVTSVEIPKERSVDIDDIYDFWFAETLFLKGREYE